MRDLSKTHKKHAKHMSPHEKDFIKNKILSINNWKFRPHSTHKMVERGASTMDVLESLKNFNIIEFHKKEGEVRVLIRGTSIIYNDNICVVVAPNTNEVVTAYFNDVKDNHFTLDMRQYTKSIDVIKIF